MSEMPLFCSSNRRASASYFLREQLLSRNVEQFRGGLVSKAHKLLYHSTLGLRVIKNKKKKYLSEASGEGGPPPILNPYSLTAMEGYHERRRC